MKIMAPRHLFQKPSDVGTSQVVEMPRRGSDGLALLELTVFGTRDRAKWPHGAFETVRDGQSLTRSWTTAGNVRSVASRGGLSWYPKSCAAIFSSWPNGGCARV